MKDSAYSQLHSLQLLLPLVGSICLITATVVAACLIVLSLIPLYVPQKAVTVATSRHVFEINFPGSLGSDGPLDNAAIDTFAHRIEESLGLSAGAIRIRRAVVATLPSKRKRRFSLPRFSRGVTSQGVQRIYIEYELDTKACRAKCQSKIIHPKQKLISFPIGFTYHGKLHDFSVTLTFRSIREINVFPSPSATRTYVLKIDFNGSLGSDGTLDRAASDKFARQIEQELNLPSGAIKVKQAIVVTEKNKRKREISLQRFSRGITSQGVQRIYIEYELDIVTCTEACQSTVTRASLSSITFPIQFTFHGITFNLQINVTFPDNTDVQTLPPTLTTVKTTTVQIATSADHTTTSADHTAISTDHTAISTDHTAISTDHTATSTYHTAITISRST